MRTRHADPDVSFAQLRMRDVEALNLKVQDGRRVSKTREKKGRQIGRWCEAGNLEEMWGHDRASIY